MRKKVLMVLACMYNGGTEAFTMNYFRNINKDKFQIDFLVVSGEEEYYKEEIENLGGIVYHISGNSKNAFFLNLCRVLKFLKKNKYEIVHIQACSLKFLFQMVIASKLARIDTVVGHSHSKGENPNNLLNTVIRNIMKWIVSSFLDYGFACSKDSANAKYTRKFIDSSSFYIIPNAINTEKYKFNIENRNMIRQKFDIDDEIVIGMVGRLDYGKNHQFLIDVIEKIKNQLNVKLLIVGEGYTRTMLREKAHQLKVEDKIVFAGQVSDAEKYYSAMDIFCLPSYLEGFPFVLVEAQMNGLKCLISDTITGETNISGTVGFLSINNELNWVEAILENKNKRIGFDAVEKVVKEYDIKSKVKLLESFYDSW